MFVIHITLNVDLLSIIEYYNKGFEAHALVSFKKYMPLLLLTSR
jgi:hypothetical protein